MTNQMDVDPLHLRLTGGTLRSAAADAHSGFRTSTTGLEEAAGGLFESARAALAAKADGWHQITAELTGRVGQHGDTLHLDARRYEARDTSTSTALHDAASGLGQKHRLNLEF